MNYFLLINNEQKGPYTVDLIKGGLVDRRIGPGTMAWREGLEEWKTISQMPELAPLLPVVQKGNRPALVKWLRIPAAICLFAGVAFFIIVGGSSGGIVPGILGGLILVSVGCAFLGGESRAFFRVPAATLILLGGVLALAAAGTGGIGAVAVAEIGPVIVMSAGVWLWQKGRACR